jgi:hypothetical protein
MNEVTPDAGLAATAQPDCAAAPPGPHAPDPIGRTVIPDPEMIRNGVLWAQDRGRMRAVEEWEIERYMQWSRY